MQGNGVTLLTPSPTAATHDFVPREFLGRARQFRSLVDTDVSVGTDRIIKSITTPLRKRLQSNASPVFRPETLVDVERRWQTELPTFGRIALQIERTKSGMSIVESRLSSGTVHFNRWADNQKESDVGLQRLTVIARTGFLSIEATMLASVSLHSLARFYMRSFDNSDTALRTALREIVHHHAAVLAGPGGKFAIAAGDGKWMGSRQATKIEGKVIQILCIRSFIGGEGGATQGIQFAQ